MIARRPACGQQAGRVRVSNVGSWQTVQQAGRTLWRRSRSRVSSALTIHLAVTGSRVRCVVHCVHSIVEVIICVVVAAKVQQRLVALRQVLIEVRVRLLQRFELRFVRLDLPLQRARAPGRSARGCASASTGRAALCWLGYSFVGFSLGRALALCTVRCIGCTSSRGFARGFEGGLRRILAKGVLLGLRAADEGLEATVEEVIYVHVSSAGLRASRLQVRMCVGTVLQIGEQTGHVCCTRMYKSG
jgi:hypothetical protein